MDIGFIGLVYLDKCSDIYMKIISVVGLSFENFVGEIDGPHPVVIGQSVFIVTPYITERRADCSSLEELGEHGVLRKSLLSQELPDWIGSLD